MELKETISYIEERSNNLKIYSNKIKHALKTVNDKLTNSFEIANLDFYDSEPVGSIEKFDRSSYVYLAIEKNESGTWSLCFDTANPICEIILLEDVGYYDDPILNKNAIKRLPEFLKLYAVALEKKHKEYEKMASIAEKMEKIFEGA
jgi:hypothetical protein